MAEYLIQDTTLTGIADKIRPLLGLTGAMTPEQMQTNLTTEQANIAAALAALAEKGVEVPEGANSNALAGLIAAIEAGGGGLASGTYTASENISVGGVVIYHGLGVIPKMIMWFVTDVSGGQTTYRPMAAFYADEHGHSKVLSTSFSNPALSNANFSRGSIGIADAMPTEESIRLGNDGTVGNGYIQAGNTVTWVVKG